MRGWLAFSVSSHMAEWCLCAHMPPGCLFARGTLQGEYSTHVMEPLPWSYPGDLLTHWNFRGARVSIVVPGACTYSAITSAMVGLGMPDHDTCKHAHWRHLNLRYGQSATQWACARCTLAQTHRLSGRSAQ